MQAYIKTNMRWLWLQKDLEHMFSWGTWALPQGNSLFIVEVALFLEELGLFLNENSFTH
jgi:hypothetical protein